MMRILSSEPPKFKVKIIIPAAEIIMDTPTKSDYEKMLFPSDTVNFAGYLTETYAGIIIPFTFLTASAFISDYLSELKKYRNKNKDIMKIPERINFGEQNEKLPFPIVTYSERLVKDHTGLDFEKQSVLPITEFWILLADAAKSRILERQDGMDYLRQCYNDMHRINTITPNVK